MTTEVLTGVHLVGVGKVGSLGCYLGAGIREFRHAMKEDDDLITTGLLTQPTS